MLTIKQGHIVETAREWVGNDELILAIISRVDRCDEITQEHEDTLVSFLRHMKGRKDHVVLKGNKSFKTVSKSFRVVSDSRIVSNDPHNYGRLFISLSWIRDQGKSGEWFAKWAFCSPKDQFENKIARKVCREMPPWFVKKSSVGKPPWFEAAMLIFANTTPGWVRQQECVIDCLDAIARKSLEI